MKGVELEVIADEAIDRKFCWKIVDGEKGVHVEERIQRDLCSLDIDEDTGEKGVDIDEGSRRTQHSMM